MYIAAVKMWFKIHLLYNTHRMQELYSEVLFKALISPIGQYMYSHMSCCPNNTLNQPNPTNQIRALKHTSVLHECRSL